MTETIAASARGGWSGLAGVMGFGPQKIERYGERFLAVVAAHAQAGA